MGETPTIKGIILKVLFMKIFMLLLIELDVAAQTITSALKHKSYLKEDSQNKTKSV